jgi:hypothetical protein
MRDQTTIIKITPQKPWGKQQKAVDNSYMPFELFSFDN